MREPPVDPPGPGNLPEWERYALEYLAEELRDAAPDRLGPAWLFQHSPLEKEGPTALFEFETSRDTKDLEKYYVAVGRTEPNYYPAYGLTPDEAFSLHLGTRFMLVLGVGQAPGSLTARYDPCSDVRAIVDRVAPSAPVGDVRIAAAFSVEGSLHAVLRCRVAAEDVYVFGAAAPAGFSRRVDLAPHVAYRLHLGEVLRREPAPKDA